MPPCITVVKFWLSFTTITGFFYLFLSLSESLSFLGHSWSCSLLWLILQVLNLQHPHICICTPTRAPLRLCSLWFSMSTISTHGADPWRQLWVPKTRYNLYRIATESDKKDPLYETWKRCNNMVVSWVSHFVSPSIRQTILWMDKAKVVQNDLKSRYF